MKNAFGRIFGAVVLVAALSPLRVQGAVTVYGEEIQSNDVVAASAPAVEAVGTNVPAAQTNRHAKGRSVDGNPQVRIDETGIHIGEPDPVDIQVPSYLRHREGGTNVMGIVSILSVLSPFVMVVAVVALLLYFKHRRNKLAHETLQMMIEKGAPITPELVASLKGGRHGGDGNIRQRGRPLFPGLVLLGIGTALVLSSSRGDSKAGWIVLFIGLAFLVVWLVERNNQNSAQPPR
jgi:hypothetical protein